MPGLYSETMGSVFSERVARLAASLAEAGVDAYITQDPVSMGYLHGYSEHAGERFMALCISPTGAVRMICPALSESQARRAGFEDVRTWKDGEDPMVLFADLSSDWDLESGIIAVDPTLPARMLLKIQHDLVAALFRDGESFLSDLMRVKGPDELDLLKRAGKIADDAFDEVLPQIKAGLTEKQVEKLLVDAMVKRGGEPYFCIVGAGANGAEPHHMTDETPLKDGDVVILDFGCDLQGYKSDITRTIAIGKASPRAHEMYDLVFRAHMAGRKQSGPGVEARSVDAAARAVIESAGVGDAFFHRLGHGIGMQGHEAPYINGQNEEILAPGNCFSIEPGVYFAGEFGIRIENIVAVTESGHDSMNAEPSATLIEV